MEPLSPVLTADLFAPLSAELVALLRGLGESDWTRPTIAGAWRVRDVVGHLLDVDLRNLSYGRDGQRGLRPSTPGFADVVSFINETNASGVSYAGRLSPPVLTDLLELTGQWVSRHVTSLPPDAEAPFPVAWAGEDRSANWMDIGREYTERWHHQAQIRDAVGAPRLLQPPWFQPFLDLSVRAFPRAYSSLAAPVGTTVAFEVEGETQGAWTITRSAAGWVVTRGRAAQAAASARSDADTAWRLLYNALSVDEARRRVATSGPPVLTEPLLAARSVMV